MMATRLTVQSVLEKAIEKEIEAQHLYQDLSRKVTDNAAKDAFSRLSREEKGHEELLRKYLRGEIGEGGAEKRQRPGL
jgi:rubrerythrin